MIFQKGQAALYPKPCDMEKYVRSQIYLTSYDELINVSYDWPSHDMKTGFPVPETRRESSDDWLYFRRNLYESNMMYAVDCLPHVNMIV